MRGNSLIGSAVRVATSEPLVLGAFSFPFSGGALAPLTEEFAYMTEPASVDPGSGEYALTGFDRANAMYREFRQTHSRAAVGRSWGLSRERVRQVFNQYEFPNIAKPKKATVDLSVARERTASILSLFARNGCYAETASALGLSPRAVRRVVRDSGLRGLERKAVTNQHYSDDDLLHALRAAHAISGSLSTEDYARVSTGASFPDGRPWPTAQVYGRRFGSWNKAKGRAGLRPTRTRRYSPQWSTEECMQALSACWDAAGHSPTIREYDRYRIGLDVPSGGSIRNRFGGRWPGAIGAAVAFRSRERIREGIPPQSHVEDRGAFPLNATADDLSGDDNLGRTVIVTRLVYSREHWVKSMVLKLSGGVCELCSAPAPFVRFDGTPFLEVHHVVSLAANGDDAPENSVALCPNCHRELHHGVSSTKKLDYLYAMVRRLVRPETTTQVHAG